MDITQESTVETPDVLDDKSEENPTPEADLSDPVGEEGSTAPQDQPDPVAFGDIDFEAEDGGDGKTEESEAEQPVEAASATGSASGVNQDAAIEALTKQIETLQAQLDDRVGQYVRIAADFENFRKRTQKEREDLDFQAKCSTLSDLLPVVDNFDRARMQIKPQTDQEMAIHKSYQSVYKQLVECFKRMGVAPMRAEGTEFDPNLHEAVMREPTHDYPEGTVMEELVRGYLLDERVLRHAMVKVAGAPEPGDEGNGGEP